MQYNTHICVYMKVNMMKYLINIREECLNSHQVTINIYMDDIENNNQKIITSFNLSTYIDMTHENFGIAA